MWHERYTAPPHGASESKEVKALGDSGGGGDDDRLDDYKTVGTSGYRTGLVWHERYMWHHSGALHNGIFPAAIDGQMYVMVNAAIAHPPLPPHA